MTLRILFNGSQAGPKFRHGMVRFAQRVGTAAAATMVEARDTILKRGRADISGAGRFGKRWTQGLHAEPQSGGTDELRLRVWHDVTYFMIFQRGGTIRGKPMLWIPLSFAHVPKGMRARDYPGGLFRVDRAGKAPLLLSRRDGEPKFFGKTSVRIPKKFHVVEICRQVGRELRTIYRKHFKLSSSNQ